jgi:hypothetical protein
MRGKTPIAVGVAVALAVPLFGPRPRRVVDPPRYLSAATLRGEVPVRELRRPLEPPLPAAVEQCGLVRHAFRWEPTRCEALMSRGPRRAIRHRARTAVANVNPLRYCFTGGCVHLQRPGKVSRPRWWF